MMKSQKRGLHRNKGFYFKGNKIVLESTSSRIVFSLIVLMFGIVIVLAGMDVYEKI